MKSLVLLSAGFSSRFGSPKALAKIGQRTIIEQLQNMLLAADLDEIIVVLGADAQQIKPLLLNHSKIKAVYNKDHKLGQTSSFKAGVRHLSKLSTCVGLLPVDYPFVKSQTLDRLTHECLKTPSSLVIPVFNGRKGHPPFFHSSLKSEILSLSDDTGINTLAHRNTPHVRYCEVQDEGVVLSFNTPSELANIIAKQST